MKIIRRFFDKLPGFVDDDTRHAAEADLAGWRADSNPRSCGRLPTGWRSCWIKTANCPTLIGPGGAT